MKGWSFILATILCAGIIGYLWLTGPRREIEQTNRINEHMNMLKDRLTANPLDGVALEEMIEQMNSKNSFQRTAAIAYLGLAGRAAAPAVPRLVEALNGSDGFNARAAAISLGQIGPVAESAIPDLIRAVEQKPNEDIGWFSAKSLGQIANTNYTDVVILLRKATNSPSQEMQYSAKAGLDALKSSR